MANDQSDDRAIALLSKQLDASSERLKAMLPADLIPLDRFKACILTLARRPEMEDIPLSEIGIAAMRIAGMGLDPEPAMQQVALIPFNETRNQVTRRKLEVVVMYQGLQELGYRSGDYSHIYGEVVYEKELGVDTSTEYGFECIEGSVRRLYHKRDPLVDYTNQRMIGAYAVATSRTDPTKAVAWIFVPGWQILRFHKAASKSAGNPKSPWNTNEPEMWKKTAVRCLSKSIRKSAQLAKALQVDQVHPDDIADGEGKRWTTIDADSSPANGSNGIPRLKTSDFSNEERLVLSAHLASKDVHNDRQFTQFLKRWDGTKDDLMALGNADNGGPKLVK